MAARQVVHSPCTLIYSLCDGAPIDVRQLHLILRSLHTFQVKTITAEENRVIVELEYQANVANCIQKLGPKLGEWVKCRKLKGDISRDELSELEQLQALFDFGRDTSEASGSTQRAAKKRKYLHSNKTDS